MLIGAMFALVLNAVLNAAPADAHGFLVRSDPASGATIAESPPAIRLWFSEDISPGVSSARLIDGHGVVVGGTSIAPQNDPRLLEMTVPRLEPGTYGVLWQVLTEDDGHTTTGTVVFGVGVPASAPGSAPGPAAGSAAGSAADGMLAGPAAGDVALRWARLCALAGLVGALAAVGILRRAGAAALAPTVRAAARTASNRILLLATGCAGLGVLVCLADVAWRVHRLRTPGTSWISACGDLLSGTRWGHLWLARDAVLLALVPILVTARTRAGQARHPAAAPLIAASAGALGLIWIEAVGSHAAALESGVTFAVAADALHILGACLWLGLVAALVLVLWPHAVPGAGTALARACRRPLTRLVAISVFVLLVSGLYGAGRQVHSVNDLVTTPYGRTLLVKSGLLALLFGLGLISATRLHGLRPWMRPWMRLWSGRTRRRPAATAPPLTRRMVAIEAGVAALLLLAVGILAETAPTRAQPTSDAQTRSGSVADLIVAISTTPNRPGLNAFTVTVTSTRRPPPASVDSAQLEFPASGGAPATLTLREIEPGRYFGTTQLDDPGSIDIDAVLHRAGQRLTVPIPRQPDPQPTAEQAGGPRRLAPYVNGLALLLIAVAALAGGAWYLSRHQHHRTANAADAAADVVVSVSPHQRPNE